MNRPKKLAIFSLGSLLLLLAVPVKGQPLLTDWARQGFALAQAITETEDRPIVKLTLALDQRQVVLDDQGNEVVQWQPLEGETIAVSPGDWLRYRLLAENAGTQPAETFGLEQPVPAEMVYVLGSAATPPGSQVTYSIDGSETFVAQPLVEVEQPDGTVTLEPAPADLYTHLRWQFTAPLTPGETTEVSYQVTVR
jgi:uncharacterized repeat protein (TIGR01451 family)